MMTRGVSFLASLANRVGLTTSTQGTPLLLARHHPQLLVIAPCFVGKPQTLNAEKLAAADGDVERSAVIVWRGICVANSSGSKAELANKLADRLIERKDDQSGWKDEFDVPAYLRDAIKHVWDAIQPQQIAANVGN